MGLGSGHNSTPGHPWMKQPPSQCCWLPWQKKRDNFEEYCIGNWMLWYDSDLQNVLGHMDPNQPCDPTQPQRGPQVRYCHMPRRHFLVKLFGGNHHWLSQWVCVCVSVCVCVCVSSPSSPVLSLVTSKEPLDSMKSHLKTIWVRSLIL